MKYFLLFALLLTSTTVQAGAIHDRFLLARAEATKARVDYRAATLKARAKAMEKLKAQEKKEKSK